VTGQQVVLALISAYYDILGDEQQQLEYVSGLCAAHGVEVWALTAGLKPSCPEGSAAVR